MTAERARPPLSELPFERFAAVRIIGSPKFRPDGERIAYIADTTGQHNLWTMPSRGGFPKQVTAFANRRVAQFAWSPDGSRIAFAADARDDENYQVYVIDADGGWPRRLTQADDAQHVVGGWTPDGRHLLIASNDREPEEMDVQLLDVASGERHRLVTGSRYYPGEVSPDGRWATAVEFRSNTDQDVLLVDLASRESRVVTAHEGEAQFRPVGWSSDSKHVYMLTDHGREFRGLAGYALESSSWGFAHAPDYDVELFDVARDGRTTVAAANAGGASKLEAFDLSAGREIALDPLPLGVVQSLSLHPSERRVVVALGRPTEAANLYHLDFGGEPRALEQSMLAGVPAAATVEPELVRYPSFDRDIPAWLYRPPDEGRRPVVLSIHGGPESQERPTYAYAGLYQYLASRGIAVLAPNIRGSTGYGRSYQKAIHRDWGGGELQDIRHAAEHLRAQEWVDPDRIAIFGGSFGGFAALSALSRLPEYWSAGVDIVGPSNLVTFAKSVPPHWRAMMKAWVGDPEDDREMLLERSPITYADAIRAPLLVIQGANDPRVVKAESDQMVEALRERGIDVDYFVDEESGHGPSNRDRRLLWLRMSAEFLERHLTG